MKNFLYILTFLTVLTIQAKDKKENFEGIFEFIQTDKSHAKYHVFGNTIIPSDNKGCRGFHFKLLDAKKANEITIEITHAWDVEKTLDGKKITRKEVPDQIGKTYTLKIVKNKVVSLIENKAK